MSGKVESRFYPYHGEGTQVGYIPYLPDNPKNGPVLPLEMLAQNYQEFVKIAYEDPILAYQIINGEAEIPVITKDPV